MSTSWTMNIFIYYDDDGAQDGTWDHTKKLESRRNLVLCSKDEH